MKFWKNWFKKKEIKSSAEEITTETLNKDHKLFKFKLSSYSEVTYVAKILLKKKKVLINLETLEQGERRRILDFLSGVVFFQEGKVKKLPNHIYYFFLNNFE